MSSLSENNQKQNISSIIKIEIDDINNYFISYWNLALKKLLPDYFCFFNSDIFGQIKLGMNLLNIKLVNVNNTLENNFEDKLFLIKIYFLKSEKDLTKDFFNNIKNTFDDKNMNIILISTNEIKKETNIEKDCIKFLNKIKTKTGLNDIYYLPYDIINIDKIKNYFKDFLEAFAKRFSKEFFVKINLLYEKLENFENFEKNKKNENFEEDYKYIEDLIYYFDLLIQIKCWNSILSFTEKILFKDYYFFNEKKNEKIKPEYFFNFDENKLKISYLNKKLSNIDFNEYIIYLYIISSYYAKRYQNIFELIKLLPEKLKLYEKYFKTEYHYIYWSLNYIYIFIEYINKLIEKNLINKNESNKYLIILYEICIRYYKIYKYKKNNKYFFPNKNILLTLINNIKQDNYLNIKEDIEKLFLINNNKNNNENNNYEIFIQDFNEDEKNNDKIFLILNNNKKLLNEFLNIYKIINSKFIEYTNIEISIRYIIEEIYLLISFNHFDEIKNILVSISKYKYFKNKQYEYLNKYLFFILLLVLYYLDKNNENLNLFFKILNINYRDSLSYKILKNIGYNDNNKNLIYELLSKYLEIYNSSSNNNNDNKNIILNLDNIFDINLLYEENKTLFINKSNSENNIYNIDYKITNKSGVNFITDKIFILFEEINLNNNNNKDEKNNINNIIIYEIKENILKNIEPFIKQKKENFQIEINDLFKINKIYKPLEIHYILKNNIKTIYHIKENIQIIFSDINININAELISNNFYYNILSLIKLNISNINDISLLSNKYLIINLNNNNKDSILKLQTELAKKNFINNFNDIIIKDNIIEFPPNSIKNLNDLNNLEIPFFIENTNYYNTISENKIELNIYIKESNDSKENIFSYQKIFFPKFFHLFTIGKRFKKLQSKNSYIMQTFLTLNLENTKITIYNKDSPSVLIDSKQAINMILILDDKEDLIIKKLRKNFIIFSSEINKEIKYQFCYPEKNILEEIKEMKEIPYHIIINIENSNKNINIYDEFCININIKKYKKKKSLLMINIKESENWSVIGRNKIIENLEQNFCETNIKINLLPLIDGYISLPEIEFNEYNDYDNTINNLNYPNDKFEPIEYGSIIEGEKNVVKICPLKEYNLKINLT